MDSEPPTFQQLHQALKQEHDRCLLLFNGEIRHLRKTIFEKSIDRSGKRKQQESMHEFLDECTRDISAASTTSANLLGTAGVIDIDSLTHCSGSGSNTALNFLPEKYESFATRWGSGSNTTANFLADKHIPSDATSHVLKHSPSDAIRTTRLKRVSERTVASRRSARNPSKRLGKAGSAQSLEPLLVAPELCPIWQNADELISHGSSKLEKALSKAVARYSNQEMVAGDKESVSSKLKKALPLHPSKPLRTVWDIMALLFLLHDMYAIPLQVFDTEDLLFFQIGGWATLWFWSFDMVMSFCTGYLNRYGEAVMNFRSISSRYVRTWFVPDILINCTEWCVVFLKAYMGSAAANTASYGRFSKFMRVARIFRTIRLSRLGKIKDIIYTIQYRIDSEWLSILSGVIVNVFILITLNHVVACGWFYVGSKDWGMSASWPRYYGFQKASGISQYLCSLHWSLTLFTPSSMDVHPVNDAERVYAVASVILAMIIFASFVSSVTAGFTRLRDLEATKTHQFLLLRKYLKESDISPSLSARIMRYIDISQMNHKRKLSSESVHLLRWLSGPLNIELQRELCSPHLMMHPFFFKYEKTSHSAVNEVCFTACSFSSFAKRDTLFARFAHAKEMFMLVSGSLVYRRATTLPCPKYSKVAQGSYFGEPALWVQWVSHGTMKALTEGDCMAIDCEKFGEITAAHRDAYKLSYDCALAFYARLCTCFRDHGSAWDLPLENIGLTLAECSRGFAEVSMAEDIEAQIVDWSDSEFSDDGEASTANDFLADAVESSRRLQSLIKGSMESDFQSI